jgi:protein TonB
VALQPAPPPPAAPQPAAPKPQLRVEASVNWDSCSRPQYPSGSLDRGEQGLVLMSFDLDPGGKVTDAAVIGSSGSPKLDETALRAVQKCRFNPATVDGVAVASVAKVRFQWRLHN